MADPLPSWREGETKKLILDFVEAATRESDPGFIAPADRIATFDNDGTLWCEQPLQVQFFFGRQRLAELVEKDPSLKERQPFKAFLEHDMATIKTLGKQGFFEVAASTHAGMTEDAFDAYARNWLTTARHPTLRCHFTELVYQPQLELIAYLQSQGFRTFIVSGGGIDLMRSFAEEVYGIPRNQVVGSSVRTQIEERDGKVELVKLAQIGSFDDREVKPQNIGLHIGRRPVFAFGNSDGDLAMLRYTLSGAGPRLALLVHHDDTDREFAYDREFHLSPLAEALDRASEFGIHVVSMKEDWEAVFPDVRKNGA